MRKQRCRPCVEVLEDRTTPAILGSNPAPADPDIQSAADSSPTDIALSSDVVSDFTTLALVGALSATDPDPDETFTYELVGGALDLFFVYEDQLYATFPFPFRAGSSYDVVIRVTDSDNLTFDKSFTINVIEANAPPDSADRVISIAQNESYSFSAADFAFSDHYDSAPNQPLNLVIREINGVGALTFNGNPVASGQVIPWNELNGLAYTPPLDTFGTLLGFTFAVQDDGGVGGYGQDTDPTPNAAVVQVGVEKLAGQWAHELLDFSTQYTSSSWSARQVLGKPDVPSYGDSPKAWAPLPVNSGFGFDAREHVTVKFRHPVHAVGVQVRETLGNGFVERVDFLFIGRNGRRRLLHTWKGSDPTRPGLEMDFVVAIPKTTQRVNAVRVHVNIDHDAYWEEIDAIRLLDANQPPSDLLISKTVVRRDAAPGTLVGVLTALDPDAGERFMFRLVGGPSQHFEIAGNKLLTNSSFNGRDQSRQRVRIRVTDLGGRSFEKTLVIKIRGKAPGLGGLFDEPSPA